MPPKKKSVVEADDEVVNDPQASASPKTRTVADAIAEGVAQKKKSRAYYDDPEYREKQRKAARERYKKMQEQLHDRIGSTDSSMFYILLDDEKKKRKNLKQRLSALETILQRALTEDTTPPKMPLEDSPKMSLEDSLASTPEPVRVPIAVEADQPAPEQLRNISPSLVRFEGKTEITDRLYRGVFGKSPRRR